MKTTIMQRALLLPLLISLVPAAMAQDGDDLSREERRNQRWAEFEARDPEAAASLKARREEMQAKREEFLSNNPEAAERFEARQAEMEARRAEQEARRAEFEQTYPEAAAELRSWNEQDRALREQRREEREARRAEFEDRYPDAAAELRTWREQAGRDGRFPRHGDGRGFSGGGRRGGPGARPGG